MYLGNYEQDSERFDAITDSWNALQGEFTLSLFDTDMHLSEQNMLLELHERIYNMLENLQRDFYILYLAAAMPEETVFSLSDEPDEPFYLWLGKVWEEYIFKVSVAGMDCDDAIETLEEIQKEDSHPEHQFPGSVEKRIQVMKKIKKIIQEELLPYLLSEVEKMEIDIEPVIQKITDYWNETYQVPDVVTVTEITIKSDVPEEEPEITLDKSSTLKALKEFENFIEGENP